MILTEILNGVHSRVSPDTRGEVASYIPALSDADPEAFGIAIVTASGEVHTVGDADAEFSIQSVSKPLSLAMALHRCGHEEVFSRVGTEPSGDAFNSVVLRPATGLPYNPMVNAGAIAIAGLLVERFGGDAFDELEATLGRFAGDDLGFDEAVYESESATADRNRAIAHLLRGSGALDADVEATVDLYTRQCSLTVSAVKLASMAATLANIGMNPVTKESIVDPLTVRHALSLMFTCGMYDYAGHWAVDVGVPAKSGVSGGLMAVVNRQIGIGIYSPRLDERGNSVRAIRACEELSEELGLHAFEFSNAGSSLLGAYV